MKTKWLSLSVFLLFAWVSCLGAELQNDKPPKYNLSVCALFKNEALYLKEWIEYHRFVGVDHFYLYNYGSTDRYLSVLKPYIKGGVVTLIEWHDTKDYQSEENTFIWSLSTQVSAYENAAKYAALNETEWLAFLDVDEFLLFPTGDNLTKTLEKYKKYPGVNISANSFDASASLSVPGRKLLIETVELVKPTPSHPQKAVSKVIFKPRECKGFSWPPYQCHFKNDKQPKDLGKDELCINRYENRFKGHLFYGRPKDKLHVDNRMLTEEESTEFLEMGYEIEDQERVIYRFVPDMLIKMGFTK